jgi:hypothetical protein
MSGLLNASNKQMAKIGRKAVAICVVAVLLSGCGGRKILVRRDSGKLYAVTAQKTPFFRYGPQQGSGADMELPKDTLMTLIRPSFGFCKVHLTSGEEGYVASEDIDVASPALIAAVTGPPPAATHSGGEERFNLDSADPRLSVPPEELPGDWPEPTPLPGTSP